MQFTYSATIREHLSQGDIVRRSEEVDELLSRFHPHYHANKDYKFFIVLTQSCDLVRRGSERTCKSRYITIAAVRPLRTALLREFDQYMELPLETKFRLCNRKYRPKMAQYMERLLNNNHPSYFYLHEEPSVGFDSPQCAFLQLSVALKSELHYESLLRARVLQLTESFQHKLGSLVGSLYSRIGTEDWVPVHSTQQDSVRRCEAPISDADLVMWLDPDIHRWVLQKLEAVKNPTEDDLKRVVEEITSERKARKDRVLGIIAEELSATSVQPETTKMVVGRLKNRQDFRSALK